MKLFLETSAQADVGTSQDGDLSAAARKFSGVSSAHFLRLVEERGTTGFWTCDLATGQSSVSPGLLRVIGVETPQPFAIMDLINQVHPDDRLRSEDLWPLIRSGVPVNRSFRIIRGDRTVRWVEFRSEVVLDAEQRPARVIGLLQDVSQDHENQQALEESLGRYRALVGAVAAMEWRATASGEPVFSQGWTVLTGQREADVLNGSWVEAIHPEDRQAVITAWKNAVSNLTPYEAYHRIMMTNGDYEWFLARAVPILHKSGRLHEWLGILIRQRGLKGIDPVNASADSLLTPMQIRAGRAMLQWTLEDLSQHSGVSISSIRRIEAEGERATRPASLNAIRQAFEQEGLIFSDGNGVALQRAEGRRL